MNRVKVTLSIFSIVILISISLIVPQVYSNNMLVTPLRSMWLDNSYLYSSSPVKTIIQAQNFLKSIGNPDFIYVRPARVYNGNPTIVTVMTLNLARLIHSASSSTKVLAIVDIVTDDPRNDIYCDLSIQSNRDTLTKTIAQVINIHGFDGVYLDIEPLESGTIWLPQMIQQLKRLTVGKIVIVYSSTIVDNSRAGITGWSLSYLKSVALAADYLEIRLYNFDVKTVSNYKDQINDQVARIATAGLSKKTFFILPCYPNNSFHDSSIENITNAGPLVKNYNTGLFSQLYMTEADYIEYLSLFGR